MSQNLDQCAESKRFCDANRARITAVENGIAEKADILLKDVLAHVLPPKDVHRLKETVAKGEYSRFYFLVRSKAAVFFAEGISDTCWEWIDAYSFYSDAVGTRWPYMTQARRASLLESAAAFVRLAGPEG